MATIKEQAKAAKQGKPTTDSTVRAIKVDPSAKTVEWIDLPPGEAGWIAIKERYMATTATVRAIGLALTVDAWLDDDILENTPDIRSLSYLSFLGKTMAGVVVITGSTLTGEITKLPDDVDPAMVEKLIMWIPIKKARLFDKHGERIVTRYLQNI